MLTTEQANEATVNNIYPPASLPREERVHLIPIYNAERERIVGEWRKWLAHTYLPDETVGSDLETMVWAKVIKDAESSVKNSRDDNEANYKELVALVSFAREGFLSEC